MDATGIMSAMSQINKFTGTNYVSYYCAIDTADWMGKYIKNFPNMMDLVLVRLGTTTSTALTSGITIRIYNGSSIIASKVSSASENQVANNSYLTTAQEYKLQSRLRIEFYAPMTYTIGPFNVEVRYRLHTPEIAKGESIALSHPKIDMLQKCCKSSTLGSNPTTLVPATWNFDWRNYQNNSLVISQISVTLGTKNNSITAADANSAINAKLNGGFAIINMTTTPP